MILVDAGPLIALIHEDDNEHDRCREAFAAMNEPLGTVWPVIAEAMHRRIFTLDRRGFEIYRPSRIGRFSILPSR